MSVLKVVRHILHIVGLQLQRLQVQSPEGEHSLVSKSDKLDVPIIDVGVYFYLVDSVMSD